MTEQDASRRISRKDGILLLATPVLSVVLAGILAALGALGFALAFSVLVTSGFVLIGLWFLLRDSPTRRGLGVACVVVGLFGYLVIGANAERLLP